MDKSEVYVNTSADTDGALVKVGPNFYRAMNGEPTRQVSLEKLEIESNRRYWIGGGKQNDTQLYGNFNQTGLGSFIAGFLLSMWQEKET